MSFVQNRQEAGYSVVLDVNGQDIPYRNVDGMVIRESAFSILPRCSITIRDVGGYSSATPIISGDNLTLSVVSDAGESGDVHYPFHVMRSTIRNVDPNLPNNALVTLDGILNFPEMFGSLKSAVFNGKFSEAVEEVARLTGMKSEIRIRSNDKMKWSCFGQNYMDFLTKSISHCHISDKECPVIYGTKDGKLVFDGLKRASESTTRISLVFDALGTLVPASYSGNDLNKKGLSESLINVPYSNWSRTDVNEFMMHFGGGEGITLSYYDGGPIIKKYLSEGSTGTDERMVYGVKTLNVHNNYYSAMVQNKMNKNKLFGSCITLNTGLYGFKPLDMVHVTIPAGNLGDTSEELSGDYLIFQVITVFNRDAKGEMVSMAKVV